MKIVFRKIIRLFIQLGIDWFTPALLIMIVLAWFWPEGGLGQGAFSLKSLAGYGISVIFFLYGLRLSVRQLIGCLSNWKLHLIIQSVTFIVFPVLILLFKPLFDQTSYEMLWLGAFFLAAMPSTVSSAVVMVSLANGNVPAAVFNASVSSIAGILIAPLWLGLVLASGSESFDMLPVLIKLGYQVLLPLIAGVMLNKWFGKTAIRFRNYTRYFDQTVILAIVYTSFSNSFTSGLFDNLGIGVILVLILLLLVLFGLINGFIFVVTRKAGLDMPDTITALFCGSTKSLMHGTVMAKVIFGTAATGGVILLPILIYHALQLTITGIMSQQFSKRNDK
ncbi:MAG: bile acid:sodium symporter [Lentimicrobium sp.]|nr:bile acid:sodium symporter [Lentimicrobium sp.]